MTAPAAQRCYRHPTVETYARCTRCERPICPECMVPATVGHQCPECVREGRKHQRTVRLTPATPYVAYGFIGVCVVMMVLTQGGQDAATLYRFGAAFGPAVATGEWWRLVTPMFLHFGLLHFMFNMFALYLYGLGLERVLGSVRFAALLLASGFLGSALSFYMTPVQIGVGASGAVFGVLGAWAVWFYRRRNDARAEQMLRAIVAIIGLNLVFGFTVRGIDNWAHLGGLLGGIIISLAADESIGHRSRRFAQWTTAAGVALVIALGVLLVAVKIGDVEACRLVETARGLACLR